MKIAYKGYLYEENYHSSEIGYFNDNFQEQIQQTTNEILPQVLKLLRTKINYIPSRLIVSDKQLPIIYFHNKTKDGSDATVEEYDNGILLRFNDYYFANNVLESRIKRLLFHEITHIYQIAKGLFDFKNSASSGLSEDERRFKYFNDPKEINALINSVVAYLINDKSARDSLKNASLDKFYRTAFMIMGYGEDELKEYMEENAIITFYESLRFLWSRLRRGEYDRK